VPRKLKKRLRAIMLCHTGNAELAKMRISKSLWAQQKEYYDVWSGVADVAEMRSANSVKRYKR